MNDYQIFLNKKSDRIYISRAIEHTLLQPDKLEGLRELNRNFRIVSKVLDTQENHEFILQGKELVLRITEGQRQEIVAKFYEDTRGIFTLQIQKYSTDGGTPHKVCFSFKNEEITKLFHFIKNIALIPIEGEGGMRMDDAVMNEIVLSRQETLQIFKEKPEVIAEILKNDISCSELLELAYRKEQLNIFDQLLHDAAFFEQYKVLHDKRRDEDAWQCFFENNTWIFGYGLNYLFNSPLEGKKLEQVTAGFNFHAGGKRIDALMKTRGLISSLCFAEIKTHRTRLLQTEYRADSYSVSNELTGGIAQVQKTIQKSIRQLNTKIDLKGEANFPTGETVFLYQPRSILVTGSLSEFKNEHGVSEEQYASFELFRRNLTSPEIITFDELFERAKYIVGDFSYA